MIDINNFDTTLFTDTELKCLKWWKKTSPFSYKRYLKNKSITSKQYDFLKSSTSAGFAFLFFYIILMVCLANVFGGVPMGEATINPYSNELVDPSKMQIGFVVGLIGSTYYGREYFFHQKFLRIIKKNVKITL